ncbi:MAG: DUF1648 domain-containing protein [Micropruina sp.]|nr:DUF1648 domain-containing protein [Micropruina sp.]
MIRSLAELTSPQARATAQDFLDAAGENVPRGLRGDVLGDLTAHLCDRLEADATAAQVEDVLSRLSSEELLGAAARPGGPPGLRLRGLFARVAETWWNPGDERTLLPRAVGLGWDLNLGALAVRLGLIEPDAEAVPFDSTPARAFRSAAAVPLALAGATAVHYLVRGPRLPERLPSHWDAAGRPDRWIGRRAAAAIDVTVTASAAGLALWAVTGHRPGPVRAGALALAGQAAGVVAAGAVTRPTAGGWWVGPVMLGAALGGPAAMLLGLARAGRNAEIERDLADGR